MKLNNKGWSFSQMMFLMSLLVIFLLISIFYIIKFYSSIEKASNSGKEYIENRSEDR